MFKCEILGEAKGIRFLKVNDTYQLYDIECDFTFACMDDKEEAMDIFEKKTGIDLDSSNMLKLKLEELKKDRITNDKRMNSCKVGDIDLYMYNGLDINEEIYNIESQIYLK